MSCAVLQRSIEPVPEDQLKAALAAVPGLTAVDAAIRSRDAYGILGRGYDFDAAMALKQSLAALGIETEIIEEAALPPLPEERKVRRLDFSEQALVLYDPLGQALNLPWGNIIVLAAGKVRTIEFEDVRTERKEHQFGRRGSREKTVVEHNFKERLEDAWRLDLLITGASLRFTIVASKSRLFPFICLGERRTDDLAVNFQLLVQDIEKHATNATLNRGANALAVDIEIPWRYPSPAAFNNETVWLLWQLSLGASPAPPP
jgi:hypothetical protein